MRSFTWYVWCCVCSVNAARRSSWWRHSAIYDLWARAFFLLLQLRLFLCGCWRAAISVLVVSIKWNVSNRMRCTNFEFVSFFGFVFLRLSSIHSFIHSLRQLRSIVAACRFAFPSHTRLADRNGTNSLIYAEKQYRESKRRAFRRLAAIKRERERKRWS